MFKKATVDSQYVVVMDRVIADTDPKLLKIFKRHANDFDRFTLTNDTYQRGSKAKPKSADMKAGLETLKELVDINGYNVVGVMGAETFEKVMGFKGISKYINRPVWSEVINCKVVALVHPSQLMYGDPALDEAYAEGFRVLQAEAEFPELRQEEASPVSYTIINTIGKFRKFLDYYLSDAVTEFAYDLETTGFRFNVDQILTIQFSHAPFKSYLIPVGYGAFNTEEIAEISAGIKRLFADDSKTLVGHNIKFDNRFLEHHWGVPVRKHNVFDTMIASFLCDETTPNGLKELSCQFTDLGAYDDGLDEFRKKYCKANKIKEGDFSFDLYPFDVLAEYALKDADCTIRLYHLFKQKLVEEQQTEVFKMVMRFQYLLSRMEITGSPVDVEYAEQYLVEVDQQLEEMKHTLHDHDFIKRAEEKVNQVALKKWEDITLIGGKAPKPKHKPFNLNSTDQKRVLFYDVMKLPCCFVSGVKNDIREFTFKRMENLALRIAKEAGIKLTRIKDKVCSSDINAMIRRKAAVDKRSIAAWSKVSDEKANEFMTELRRYSELTKIRNTYIVAILEKQVAGWIHPSFNVIGAKSGRLSCKDPNYQNIPAHSDEAKKVKRITKAPEGWVLIGADLSAAEMRWVTIASGDEKMAAVFNSGKDSHGAIAKDIFNLECDANEVKTLFPKERQISKSCQFLSIYGGQASALSATAGITEERAQEILDEYFETYTGIKDYLQKTREFVCLNGYSQSLLGRRNRHLMVPKLASAPHLEQDEHMVLEKEIRVAINATIQSVSSDGMLLSACSLQDEIEAEGWQDKIKIVNVIHDAIYCLVREEHRQEMHDVILKHLTTLPKGLVCPFTQQPIALPISMEADAEWGYSWDKFSDDFGLATDSEESEDEEESEE